MLLKLMALGVLGYVAYRYRGMSKAPERIALAGGPLSDQATLQKDPNLPPAA